MVVVMLKGYGYFRPFAAPWIGGRVGPGHGSPAWIEDGLLALPLGFAAFFLRATGCPNIWRPE